MPDKIKSDGGSTAYYDFPADAETIFDLTRNMPPLLMEVFLRIYFYHWEGVDLPPLKHRDLDDLMACLEMSCRTGNVFKACYRYGQKHGNDGDYELNKMRWFARRMVESGSFDETKLGNSISVPLALFRP